MLRSGHNPKCLLMPDQLDGYSWSVAVMAGAATADDWRMWFEFVCIMWEYHKFDPVECKSLLEYLN